VEDNNVRRSFVWREIDAAFENRILTGAIINADYIEPRRFLEDISSVVLERVQDTIERLNCIKVNTIYNGEFATGDKRANKSINTKNYEVFQTSNLRVVRAAHRIHVSISRGVSRT